MPFIADSGCAALRQATLTVDPASQEGPKVG